MKIYAGVDISAIDEKRLGDLDYAEDVIKSLYLHMNAELGPFVTRGLFNLHAPPVTPREMQLCENGVLYWKLLNMEPAPNINRLAKQLAKQTGKDEDATKKKIQRASKNPEVRKCLREMLFEFGADYDLLDTLESKLDRRRHFKD